MYDAICVGSGLIGGAAASGIRLSRYLPKQKVLLLDNTKRPNFVKKEVKDIRQIALNSTSYHVLRDVNAWPLIADRAWPVHKMSIAEAMGRGGILFESRNNTPLNYITEAGLISKAVVDAAEENGVDLGFESEVSDIVIPDRFNPQLHGTDFVKLRVNGSDMTTKLLVGCDGVNSMVRKSAGLKNRTKSYDQRGVVFTAQIDSCENFTAYQRFLPTSILAYLPCEHDQVSVVWSCSNKEAQTLQALPNEELVNRLNQSMVEDFESPIYKSLHSLLEPVAKSLQLKEHKFSPPEIKNILSPVASFSLSLANSKCISTRTVLLGDAAHRMHPMAGQGANMGYKDVDILLDTLELNNVRGIDPYSEASLKEFEDAANWENYPMMYGVDMLKQCYEIRDPIFSTLRNMGTTLINNNFALKFLLMNRAG